MSDLYLQGKTQVEIGHLLGVGQATISRDLTALQKAWQASALRNLDAMKSQELAKIDRLEREYYEAWQRSRQSKKTDSAKLVQAGETNRQESSTREEMRDGDPRYLNGVQWCIDRRCKLLGLDAPKAVDVTSGGQPVKTYITVSPDDWDNEQGDIDGGQAET